MHLYQLSLLQINTVEQQNKIILRLNNANVKMKLVMNREK